MNKIKILLLAEPVAYGSRTGILSLCDNIDRSVFDISIAAKSGEPIEKDAANRGIKFYPFELPKMLRIRYLKKLLSLQRDENFDIVHSHGSTAGFYGRTMKKHMPGIKSVHTFHGNNYLKHENFFSKNLSKTIEQYLVQFTDMTISETRTDLDAAIKNRIASETKSIVINNGINLTKFSNIKKNTGLLDRLGLSAEHFIVGSISEFTEQKNQKLIIQAAYYLEKKYPEMRFILAGGGKTLKTMQEYAREADLGDHIIFTGEINNVSDYYSIFNVFVYPSLTGGMPYSLLEAMASRNAIVCSNLPNLLEVVKNNYSALTINPDDMDDMFRKISLLYLNPDIREKIAQNAMIESTGYDETEVTKQIENVYKGVLEA